MSGQGKAPDEAEDRGIQELRRTQQLMKALQELASTVVQREEPMVFLAKVLQDGRVTIPIEWRELLKIEEGDIVKMGILQVYKRTQQKV
jgi:hypothetical protein